MSRRFLTLSLALALSLALFAVAQAAGLFATSVFYSHPENIGTPTGTIYTVGEALVGAPDGKLAVWKDLTGAAGLDMGQKVCGPLYIYAPAPAADTTVSGFVAIAEDTPTDSGVMQPDGGNYLYASDYANGRYTVSQFFLGNPLGLTSTPYTGGFQAVYLLNGALDADGFHATQLTVDAVEGSPCAIWTLKGFYQPVDMSTETSLVYNSVKGGSTVPLKFEIFDGETEITSVDAVKSLTYAPTACEANTTYDEIETLATGGTSLRYDTTAGQFVYNWQTPKTGQCYRVTVTTQYDSTLVAYFKLK